MVDFKLNHFSLSILGQSNFFENKKSPPDAGGLFNSCSEIMLLF